MGGRRGGAGTATGAGAAADTEHVQPGLAAELLGLAALAASCAARWGSGCGCGSLLTAAASSASGAGSSFSRRSILWGLGALSSGLNERLVLAEARRVADWSRASRSSLYQSGPATPACSKERIPRLADPTVEWFVRGNACTASKHRCWVRFGLRFVSEEDLHGQWVPAILDRLYFRSRATRSRSP